MTGFEWNKATFFLLEQQFNLSSGVLQENYKCCSKLFGPKAKLSSQKRNESIKMDDCFTTQTCDAWHIYNVVNALKFIKGSETKLGR